MSFSAWSQLVVVCVLGAMSPGPSLVVIAHNVSYGRLHGVLAGVGHGIGVGAYAIIAVVGLAVLFENMPKIFRLTNILGACFLILFGKLPSIKPLIIYGEKTDFFGLNLQKSN